MTDDLTGRLHGFAVAHPWLTMPVIVLTAIALFGGGLLYLAVALRRREGTRMLAAGVLGIVAITVVCRLISGAHYVDRPFVAMSFGPLFPHAVNASFPSSLTATIAVGARSALVAARWLGWLLLGATLIVAFGCVYVGVHWIADVVAGAVIGLACGAGAWWLGGVPAIRPVLSRLDALIPWSATRAHAAH